MEFFKSKPLISLALEKRDLRNKLISSNIANIDTPFYKARDIDFESSLIKEASKIYSLHNQPVIAATNKNHFGIGMSNKLAVTNERHMQDINSSDNNYGTIFARDGHLQRNDANTVDLDVETSELSKNAIMINALDTILRKQSDMVKNIIETSAKLG